VEAAVMPGKGKVQSTGKLGDVMKESIQAALTVVRSRSAKLGITGAELTRILFTTEPRITVAGGGRPRGGRT